MNDRERFEVLDSSYLRDMAEVFRKAFENDPWNNDWSDEEQLMKYIEDIACSFNSLNYGIIIDGKLAAFSAGSVRHWWEGTNYNIEELCVLPEFQGKGIGSRFMALIEEDIGNRGIKGIFLQTDNDMPSYRFYLKNGFSELNAHVSFYKSID